MFGCARFFLLIILLALAGNALNAIPRSGAAGPVRLMLYVAALSTPFVGWYAIGRVLRRARASGVPAPPPQIAVPAIESIVAEAAANLRQRLGSTSYRWTLVDQITSIAHYRFHGGDEYRGPIEPVGFYAMVDNDTAEIHRFLCLAEHVALSYTLVADGSEPYPTGIVAAALDEHWQLSGWDAEQRTLRNLSCNPSCPGGTMEAACAEASGRRLTFAVLERIAWSAFL